MQKTKPKELDVRVAAERLALFRRRLVAQLGERTPRKILEVSPKLANFTVLDFEDGLNVLTKLEEKLSELERATARHPASFWALSKSLSAGLPEVPIRNKMIRDLISAINAAPNTFNRLYYKPKETK